MAYNNYNKELAEFQKWTCLVRNDRLISTSKNKNQVRNCKDLLIKLKNDPMNIDNFLKDEDRKNIFPESREYQMVNTLKKLMNHTEDLKVTRVVYDNQKKSFNERWEKLEEGKRKMKNNLYKYNNIVKEKQRKVADELSKLMIEKQKQAKLGAEKKKIEKNRSILKETRERLTKSISKLEHFCKFLESAVNHSGGEFLEVKQMIDRIMILVEIRNSLRDRAETLESTIFTMKSELDDFVLKTEKESIASQVSIPRLQRELVESAAARAALARKLGNIKELKLDKQILITRIQMTVGNMLRHVNRKTNSSEREENSITEKLGAIAEHIKMMAEINKFVRISELPKYYHEAIPTSCLINR